jgi:arsenate reductase-like glutaredoxin family protein
MNVNLNADVISLYCKLAYLQGTGLDIDEDEISITYAESSKEAMLNIINQLETVISNIVDCNTEKIKPLGNIKINEYFLTKIFQKNQLLIMTPLEFAYKVSIMFCEYNDVYKIFKASI